MNNKNLTTATEQKHGKQTLLSLKPKPRRQPHVVVARMYSPFGVSLHRHVLSLTYNWRRAIR